jgi:hypothetical protein
LASGDEAEFSLVTARGWVRFTAGADWAVLSMDTKTPLKTALFQVGEANPETSDATGVAIILFQMDSKQASDAFSAAREKATTSEKSRLGQWEIFKADRKKGDTMYTIWTAFRDIADVHMTVRWGWPHLSKNPPNYSSEMERAFQDLLKSITGEIGNYQRRQNEVIRRPD